jgi:hypothetical protein
VESFGHRADVVAVKDGLVWVFECKLSLNLEVLSQAFRWVGRAHLVSVCTPVKKMKYHTEDLALDFFRSKGVGWLTVNMAAANDKYAGWSGFCTQAEPRKNRAAHDRAVKLREALHVDMNNYVAGSNGAYSTPYKRAMDEADRVIKNNPGISLRDLADKVSHHYSSKASAMGMFRGYIERFGETYRLEKDGRELRVYPIPIVGK